MDYKQIIERLSLIRTKNDLTARKFGRMLGNSDTYFYKIEDGSIVLSLPKFLEMLEALNITPEQFFYDDLDNYENDQQLLSLIKTLSKDERDALTLLLKRKK